MKIMTIITETKFVHRNLTKNRVSYGGIRFVQYVLVLFGLAIGYSALRVNLSVGIVAMTNKNHTNSEFETFDWGSSIKQTLLGSIMWGIVFSQIPGAFFSKRFGCKHGLGGSILLASIITIISPTLALIGDWEAFMVSRILLGCAQGFIFPSIQMFLSKWVPKNELARVNVFLGSGMILGIFIMMASSGTISSFFGWPYIFYISGGCGILWVLIWSLLSANTPAEHNRISEAEEIYIQNSLGHNRETHKQYIPTPWKKIFTSIPFYAALLVFTCNGWLQILILTELPMFINGIFQLDINQNALLSSTPYLTRFLFEYVLIGIEYYISKNQLMTMQMSRKFFTVIGLLVPALCLGGLNFIPRDYVFLSVLVLIIANSSNAALGLGCSLAVIDMAPNHASMLFALTGSTCSLLNIIMPVVVATVVSDESNQDQWQIIFLGSSVYLIIGCITYFIFGSNEVQSWNNLTKKQVTDEKLNKN